MGSVSSLPSGLAYLTQPGGVLSNLPSSVSTADLQSASPEDIVSLSLAAIQAQNVDGLFGVSPTDSGTADSTNENSILSLLGSAALTNATPQEKAEISAQAVSSQQIQALFNLNG
jgi:hypothetical protein